MTENGGKMKARIIYKLKRKKQRCMERKKIKKKRKTKWRTEDKKRQKLK